MKQSAVSTVSALCTSKKNTDKTTLKLAKAARSLINSEIPSLRHRVADGYAVVEVSALEALRVASEAAKKETAK
jgi:hypothetical protein